MKINLKKKLDRVRDFYRWYTTGAGINQRLDEFVRSEELHDDATVVAIKVE